MSETPRHGHAPIKMRRRQIEFFEGPEHSVGEFLFETYADGQLHLELILPSSRDPRGCYIAIPVSRQHAPGKAWGWDGNEETPTITPSIHTHGVWHGWVRNGELVEA